LEKKCHPVDKQHLVQNKSLSIKESEKRKIMEE
jgi:hypothetical protein